MVYLRKRIEHIEGKLKYIPFSQEELQQAKEYMDNQEDFRKECDGFYVKDYWGNIQFSDFEHKQVDLQTEHLDDEVIKTLVEILKPEIYLDVRKSVHSIDELTQD
jgi:hypothetical protein